MTLDALQAGLVNTSFLYSILLGLYGFWLYFRDQGVTSGFRGALVIGQVVVMSLFGVEGLRMLSGWLPTRAWVHILYAVVAVISIPAMYFFTQGRTSRREVLMYAVLGFFLLGVLWQANNTALYPRPY